MTNKFTIGVLLALIISVNSYSQCGLDPTSGLSTISAGSQIINSYFPGTGNPAAGSISLTTGAIDSRGSATGLIAGDLVLIMQIQGADINSTNSDSYGDGVAGGNASGYTTTNLVAGRYEYNTVSTVAGNLITFTYALVNDYYSRAFASGAIQAYQIVRIPRYFDLTIDATGSVTAPSWNGQSGGVIVVDAANMLTVNGSVNATGLGFRGGGGLQMTGATGGNTNGTGALTNTDYRWNSPVTTAANFTGGAKGEGIAGTPVYIYNPGAVVTTVNTTEGYISGSMGWGAPANAGGGATDGAPVGATTMNQYNTGGGGGANGGFGGKGGSGWHGNAGNVTTYPTGGFGGAPFVQRSVSQFILGGGGGAGSANNSTAANQYMSSGASGGGIILLRAGSFAGTGTLSANGANAVGLLGAGGNTDAAGGGGAGGTIVAVTRTNVPAGLGAVTASAAGGNGGNMETHFDHGPGGGGGGGVIISNGSFLSTNVVAGSNGFTRAGAPTNPVTNSYGALPGTTGELITLPAAPDLLNALNAPSPCGTLPVKLVSFTASLNGSVVLLNWEVADARDFSKFDVEYSHDGNSFISIGLVAFQQNKLNYRLPHNDVITPVNFYRLKLIDENGEFTYSKILRVRKSSAEAEDMIVYPQPAKGGYTNVQLTAKTSQKVTVQLFSANGLMPIQKHLQLSGGINTFILDNLDHLPAGIYTLRMQVDGSMQSAKIMIGSR